MKPTPATLVEMMRQRARTTPDRTAFTFSGQAVSFGQLCSTIQNLAGQLLGLGLGPGDRGVVAIPNGPEFFEAFYGLLVAGAAAAPLFPNSGPKRIASIAELCRAKTIIVPADFPENRLADLSDALTRKIPIIKTGRAGRTEDTTSFPLIKPDDPALIQYTSGSTGNPKGVLLSHRNLLTNMEQMIRGMAITESDVFVSWLPVHHDMGLILMTMVPFLLAAKLHLLPTDLKDVGPWLKTIQDRQGTFIAAPDFAYRLCVGYVKNPSDFDLTSLRVALNAAELVRPGTMADFQTAFGLDRVMVPGYGLAEATVGVSMWPPGTEPAVDTRGFVSVGPPFPHVEIRIENGGVEQEPGQVGDILVKSPANTVGYLDNPTATQMLFTDDGYVATGDLGYLDEQGNLFIVGRRKSIIIRAGQTISPKEIEEIADLEKPVRFSAAIGVDRGRAEGEQVYVFVEIRNDPGRTEQSLAALARAITNGVKEKLGFRPARVYLLKPRSIALTQNGKIQHGRVREEYLSGELMKQGRILFPDF